MTLTPPHKKLIIKKFFIIKTIGQPGLGKNNHTVRAEAYMYYEKKIVSFST